MTKSDVVAVMPAPVPGGETLLRRMMDAVVRVAGGGRPAAGRRMSIVETLPLGPKRQVVLIVCDGERYLVGTGGDHVQTIVRVGSSTLAVVASEPM